MPWGAVACSKPVPHCGPTVDPSVHLWRCVGLHRSPRKPGSKARAAVFVGFASAPFSPNPGVPRRVPSLPHTVSTLLILRCVFRWTLGFIAALGSPVQRQKRRYLWGAPQLLSALSLLSERCPGVPRRAPSLSHTVSTFWILRCVFGGTLGFTVALGSLVQRQERRCLWGAPQLLSALLLVSDR